MMSFSIIRYCELCCKNSGKAFTMTKIAYFSKGSSRAPSYPQKDIILFNPLTLGHANIGFESKCCMRYMDRAE